MSAAYLKGVNALLESLSSEDHSEEDRKQLKENIVKCLPEGLVTKTETKTVKAVPAKAPAPVAEKPKKPPTGYANYTSEVFKALKTIELPGLTGRGKEGGLSPQDNMYVVSGLWALYSPDEKAIWPRYNKENQDAEVERLISEIPTQLAHHRGEIQGWVDSGIAKKAK